MVILSGSFGQVSLSQLFEQTSDPEASKARPGASSGGEALVPTGLAMGVAGLGTLQIGNPGNMGGFLLGLNNQAPRVTRASIIFGQV